MSAIILGTSGATEQPVKLGWSQDRGFYCVREWKGPAPAINILIAQAFTYKLQYDVEQVVGGLGRITITYGSSTAGAQSGQGPDIVDNWELLPNKVQKDIFHADCTIVNSQTSEQLDSIKSFVNHSLNDDGTSKANPAAWDSNSETLYELVTAGVDHWVSYQPVLRRTYRVPQGQSLIAAYSNIKKILTTATLISTEGVPPDFVLPINTIAPSPSNPTRSDSVDLAYGWLKGIPTANIAAYVTREVHLEWEYGLWATALYGSSI